MRDGGGLSGQKWTCFLLRLPQVGSGERSEPELTSAASIQRWGERDGTLAPQLEQVGRAARLGMTSGQGAPRLTLVLSLD